MRFESQRRGRRGVGLTPLIDVVFLLLIFFMLASSFAQERALTLEVAELGPRARLDQSRALRVELGSDGSTRVEGRGVARSELIGALARALGDAPGRPVLVIPEDGASVQQITWLLERVSQAGGSDVTLARSR
jgi:biopolymer transport protein ExbD